MLRGATGTDDSFLGEALKLIGIAGGLAYIAGLCFYARSKNRAWVWGLTGLLCLVGGVTVVFLKDKSVSQDTSD